MSSVRLLWIFKRHSCFRKRTQPQHFKTCSTSSTIFSSPTRALNLSEPGLFFSTNVCRKKEEIMSQEKDKVIKSPYSSVEIPKITYPQFAFNQMEKFGQRIFLVNGKTGKEHSYHSSLREIFRVSSGLLRRGLRSGERVAFCSFNSPEYVFAWLAAAAVGATITDANPTFTPMELRAQLVNTEAKYLFVHESNAKMAKEAIATMPGFKVIYVFGKAEGCAPYSELASDDGHLFKGPVDTALTDIVHLPCSSGTTGLPKGVMRDHTNLVSTVFVTNNDAISMYASETTGLLLLPLFHSYGNMLIGTLMLKGATAVMQEKFIPEETLSLLQKHKVFNFHMAPPLVHFFDQHPMISKFDLSCLKSVVSGGAPISPKLLESLKNRLNLDDVRQGYGTTEVIPVAMSPVGCPDLSTVGPPVCNTSLKVVSIDTGEDLDIGKQGEIFVRGPHMMSGYEKNPEATQSTLVDGWLRTGDIGYANHEGHVYIVDRLKDFIKVKGHQVAPTELEALLLTNPAVQDAAVIGVPDERSGEVPRAFVVLKDKTAKTEDLKKFVAENTSKEKHLEGGVVILEAIPKSASGKILKKDLRKLSI